MSSIQTMRWVLVVSAAVCGAVAIVLGHPAGGLILLFGCALHTAHWYLRERGAGSAGFVGGGDGTATNDLRG